MAYDLRSISAPGATTRIATWLSLRTEGGKRLRLARFMLAALLACVTFWSSSASALAQQSPSFLANRQMRDEAVRAVPIDQIDQRLRAKLSDIVTRPSIYRRLPVRAVDCDPDMFLFLVRYPEVIVNIWRLMDVTKVQMTRTGPTTIEATDGAGTVTSVELVYGTSNMHVFYCEGYYEGTLLRKRITGSCVILLRSVYGNQNDRFQVTNTLDVFARLDNVGVELLAKTLNPLVGKTADFNFVETLKFVGQVSKASENNGPGVQRLAANLTAVDPAVRQAFAQYADVVYQRGLLRRGVPPEPLSTTSQPSAAANDSASDQLAPSTGLNAYLEPVTPRRREAVFRR